MLSVSPTPLSGHDVQDRDRRPPCAGEMSEVVAPYPVRLPLQPVRPRCARDRLAWRIALQRKPFLGQHLPHRGFGHPQPMKVGAAVGQLAVGAVDLAPFGVQRHDLRPLALQQPVQLRTVRHRTGHRRYRAGTPAQWSVTTSRHRRPPHGASCADSTPKPEGLPRRSPVGSHPRRHRPTRGRTRFGDGGPRAPRGRRVTYASDRQLPTIDKQSHRAEHAHRPRSWTLPWIYPSGASVVAPR